MKEHWYFPRYFCCWLKLKLVVVWKNKSRVFSEGIVAAHSSPAILTLQICVLFKHLSFIRAPTRTLCNPLFIQEMYFSQDLICPLSSKYHSHSNYFDEIVVSMVFLTCHIGLFTCSWLITSSGDVIWEIY